MGGVTEQKTSKAEKVKRFFHLGKKKDAGQTQPAQGQSGDQRAEMPATVKDKYQQGFDDASDSVKDVTASYNKELYKKSRKKLNLGEWAKLGVCNLLNIDPNAENFAEEVWVRILNLAREAGLADILEIVEAFRNLSKGEGAGILKTLGTMAKGVGHGFVDIFKHWKSSLQIAGAGIINIIMPEGAELKSLAFEDLKDWAINFFHLDTIVGLVDVIRDKDGKYPGVKNKLREMFLIILDRIGSQITSMLNPGSIIKAALGNVLSNLLSGFPGGKLLSSIISGLPSTLTSMVQAVAAAMDGNFDIIANGVRTGILQGIGKVIGIILECIPQVQPVLDGIRTGLGLIRTATSFLNFDIGGIISTVTTAVGIGKAENKGAAAKEAFGIDSIASAKGAEGSYTGNLKEAGLNAVGKELYDDAKSMGDKAAWAETWKENLASVKKYNPATAKGWGNIGSDAYEDALDRAGDAESMREDGKFKNPFSVSGYKDALHGEDSVESGAKEAAEAAVNEGNASIEEEINGQLSILGDDKAGQDRKAEIANIQSTRKLGFEVVMPGSPLAAITVPDAIRGKVSGNYSRKDKTNKQSKKDSLQAVEKCHIMHYVLTQNNTAIYRSPVEDNFKRAVDCMVQEASDALKGKDKLASWKGKRALKADTKKAADTFAKGKDDDFMKDLEALCTASAKEVDQKFQKEEQALRDDFIEATQKARKAHSKKVKAYKKKAKLKVDGKDVSLASYETDYQIAKQKFEKHKAAYDEFNTVCADLKQKNDDRAAKETELKNFETFDESREFTGTLADLHKKKRNALLHEIKMLSKEIKSLIKRRDELKKKVQKYVKDGKLYKEEKAVEEMESNLEYGNKIAEASAGKFSNDAAEKDYADKKAKADAKARGIDPKEKDKEIAALNRDFSTRFQSLVKEINVSAKDKHIAKTDVEIMKNRAKKVESNKGAIIAAGVKVIDMSYTSKAVHDAVQARLNGSKKKVLDLALEQTVGAPTITVI